MTRPTDSLEYLTALAAQFPATLARIMERDSQKIILQTGGSWGSECGYFIGSEYAKPEPFHGWEGAQS